VIQLLLGMLLSLLPKRYRDRLPASAQAELRMGAIVSGFAASAICLITFVVRYLDFFQYRVGDIGQRAIDRGVEGILAHGYVQYGLGAATTVEYLFKPLSIALMYFGIEGVLRVLAGVTTHEITGTLPLYILASVEDRLSQARAERALGPRVPDIFEEVYSNEYDARIFTCRRRRHWDRMITISWNDQFYEVVGEQPGKAPHHFIYRLRKLPKGRTVRALHRFDPEELMKTPPRPGLLAWLGGVAQDKLADIRAERQPPLPDIIDTIYGKDYHLQIASQYPKEGWDHLITIEFKGTRYEILKQVGGTPTYPYVYLLRELPPGKVIRTIQHYEPEATPDSTPS
jgi:hypothetical protein